MWIRLLLQPCWMRALYLAPWCLASTFAAVALIRYQDNVSPNPFSMPVLGIVLIALACVCLAGLLAAVAIPHNPVVTPAGRQWKDDGLL